jgi:C-5 cytosine-specific DNA methylase
MNPGIAATLIRRVQIDLVVAFLRLVSEHMKLRVVQQFEVGIFRQSSNSLVPITIILVARFDDFHGSSFCPLINLSPKGQIDHAHVSHAVFHPWADRDHQPRDIDGAALAAEIESSASDAGHDLCARGPKTARIDVNVLDLFCGAVGGWSKGLALAGYTTVAACEIDDWRSAVFAAQHPGCVMYADIRDLTADHLLRDLGYLPDVIDQAGGTSISVHRG